MEAVVAGERDESTPRYGHGEEDLVGCVLPYLPHVNINQLINITVTLSLISSLLPSLTHSILHRFSNSHGQFYMQAPNITMSRQNIKGLLLQPAVTKATQTISAVK